MWCGGVGQGVGTECLSKMKKILKKRSWPSLPCLMQAENGVTQSKN